MARAAEQWETQRGAVVLGGGTVTSVVILSLVHNRHCSNTKRNVNLAIQAVGRERADISEALKVLPENQGLTLSLDFFFFLKTLPTAI